MIHKEYNKKQSNCKITFHYVPEEELLAETVQVLGDFNLWGEKKKHFLKKRKDGSFRLTLNLPTKNAYEFRYLINGSTWVTDSESDKCSWNIYGSQNGIIEV